MRAILLTFGLLTATSAFTQQITQTRYRNDVKFTLGVTGYDKIPKTTNSKGLNRFGTFIAYDGFPKERLSLGLIAGITRSTRKIEGVTTPTNPDAVEKIVLNRYVLGGNVTTYIMKAPNLNVYLGAGVAIGFGKGKLFYDKELALEVEDKAFMYDAFLGVNYYFSENLGVTGRLGYRTSVFQVGITYRY